MCDILCDPLDTAYKHDDPIPASSLRLKTPIPESRKLRRTASYASIDTIVPSDSERARRHDADDLPLSRPQTPVQGGTRTLHRAPTHKSIDSVQPLHNRSGIRLRITEIAENLKNKSEKHRKNASTNQVTKDNTTEDRKSDAKPSPAGKAKHRVRKSKATAPLQATPHNSKEDTVQVAPDNLHSGIPPEDTPSTAVQCTLDDSPYKDDELLPWENDFPEWTFEEARHVFQPPQNTQMDIKDVQFDILPSEPDVTIWDGLQAEHHIFACRLFLRCTTHPFDDIAIPSIGRVEVSCNTHPVSGTRYARPSVVQTTYNGASPGFMINASGVPNVKLAEGIHMDKFWHTVHEDDGTWGWCRDAYIPLSSRLFDKMDYRQFKVVARVWSGDDFVESELTFGISMLLRHLDME